MRTLRFVMLLLFTVVAVNGISAVAVAGEQKPADSAESTLPTYLMVQQATGGTFTAAGAGAWTLTLTGVAPHTIYFADHPARVAGTVPTAEVVTSTVLFDPADPPNGAVVLAEPASEDEDVVVVELREPVYDAAAGTLRYTVIVLGESDVDGLADWSDRADPSLPETFDHVALFIDDSWYDFCNTEWVSCMVDGASGPG